ncbi:MAG: hypothetical protein RIQ89_2126 [Bacteroidota bacterium]|jgi:prolyl oligopeptidase
MNHQKRPVTIQKSFIKLQYYMLLLISGSVNTHLVVAQKINYPITEKNLQIDDYFGSKVEDPYRWLEDDRSEATSKWVDQQNEVTNQYLSDIPFRSDLKDRLTQIWNFNKQNAPIKMGSSYFLFQNNGLQNQFTLSKYSTNKDSLIPVLDPNAMSADGTFNINDIEGSKDGKYLAYSYSNAGSDWNNIAVIDNYLNKPLPDLISYVKFSSIAWFRDGFYYSRYDAPTEADAFKGKNEFHKVYYHQLGENQSSDKLIWQDTLHPLRNFSAQVTTDQKYLILDGSQSTSGNSMQVHLIGNPVDDWLVVENGFNSDLIFIDNDDYIFYVLTNREASNYKLVSIDISHLDASWSDVILESEQVLKSVVPIGDKFVCHYMKDASSQLKVIDKKGNFLFEIPLDELCTVENITTDDDQNIIYYTTVSFTRPSTTYSYNLSTKTSSTFFKPNLNFDADNYSIKRIFYDTPDGFKVPMFIVHRKDVAIDGNMPTLLFAYGGFNISKTPDFKVERLAFLEQGGVFAMACIRGGGEYGEEWHSNGMLEKKQNVFNDFYGAAEYLIANGYTNPNKIGISGRSNGGLLVGACMIQHPELFKVALPAVGVLDMLRYHKFTIGWAWKGEYGSSETKEHFDFLYKYSPLHNVKNLPYPATLVTTGDHDDRVVPAHSYKFISTLQEKATGPNPQLIRVDINAGHAASTGLGSSKPVSKQIDEQCDVFSFLMYNLGMKYQKIK